MWSYRCPTVCCRIHLYWIKRRLRRRDAPASSRSPRPVGVPGRRAIAASTIIKTQTSITA